MALIQSGEFGSSPTALYQIHAEQTAGSGNSRTVKVSLNIKVKGSSSSTYGFPLSVKFRVKDSYSGWIVMRTSSEGRWDGGDAYRTFSWTQTVDVGSTNATGVTVGFQIDMTSGSSSWETTKTGTFTTGQTNTPPTMSGSLNISPSGTIAENTGTMSLSWTKASDSQNNGDKYQIYRYVNGSHDKTININNINTVSTTDTTVGSFGQGTKIYYKIWAGDSAGTWSNAITSSTVTKNTFTKATVASTLAKIVFSTSSIPITWSGAKNTFTGTNGTSFDYTLTASNGITVYRNTSTSTSMSVAIATSAPSSGAYILKSDLINAFKSSNYAGTLTFTLKTANKFGSSGTTTKAISVDLKTDITISSTNTSINSNSYYSISGTNYLVPGRKNITLNWGAATDPLGTSISYRVEQKIGTGSWTTLLGNTTSTSYSFKLNVSGKPTYYFRVYAKNGYGGEKLLNGSPSGVMYNYAEPNISITNAVRTANAFKVDFSVSVGTEISNAVKSLAWAFPGASKSGTLAVGDRAFTITGLTEDNSGDFTITVSDNLGATFGISTKTITSSVSKFYPVLSIRDSGVGVGIIPDGTADLMVSASESPTILIQDANDIEGKQGRLLFRNIGKDQGVHIRYNHYDNTRVPFGLHIERGAGNTSGTSGKAYLQVEGDIFANNANKVYHTGYKPTASEIGGVEEPVRIPANANLNNYTTAGFYYSPANADAQTMTNLPSQQAFSLLVEKHAGCKQTFTVYSTSDLRSWYRNYYNGTWSSWIQVLTKHQAAWSTGSYSEDKVAYIGTDAVMEVGQYIDFHLKGSRKDYDARLEVIGTNNLKTGRINATNWLYSSGNTGWYNESHGGGWYMTDASWMRCYGDKGVFTGGQIKAGGNLRSESGGRSVRVGVGSSDCYVHNEKNTGYLQLKDNGMFGFSNSAVFNNIAMIGKDEWTQVTIFPNADNVGNIGTNAKTWNTLKCTNQYSMGTLSTQKARNISPYSDKEYLYNTFKDVNLYMLNNCSTTYEKEEIGAGGVPKTIKLSTPELVPLNEIKLTVNAEEMPMIVAPKNIEGDSGNMSIELGAMVAGLSGAFSHACKIIETQEQKINELEDKLTRLEEIVNGFIG